PAKASRNNSHFIAALPPWEKAAPAVADFAPHASLSRAQEGPLSCLLNRPARPDTMAGPGQLGKRRAIDLPAGRPYKPCTYSETWAHRSRRQCREAGAPIGVAAASPHLTICRAAQPPMQDR